MENNNLYSIGNGISLSLDVINVIADTKECDLPRYAEDKDFVFHHITWKKCKDLIENKAKKQEWSSLDNQFLRKCGVYTSQNNQVNTSRYDMRQDSIEDCSKFNHASGKVHLPDMRSEARKHIDRAEMRLFQAKTALEIALATQSLSILDRIDALVNEYNGASKGLAHERIVYRLMVYRDYSRKQAKIFAGELLNRTLEQQVIDKNKKPREGQYNITIPKQSCDWFLRQKAQDIPSGVLRDQTCRVKQKPPTRTSKPPKGGTLGIKAECRVQPLSTNIPKPC